MAMYKGVRKKTIFFVAFMLGFLFMLLYFTYYSRILYVKKLPFVVTEMPERTEQYEQGRYLYYVPNSAVQRDDEGKHFICTARDYEDILGKRKIVTKIVIRVMETEGSKSLIDGMVREEPVITKDAVLYMAGQSVLMQEEVDE